MCGKCSTYDKLNLVKILTMNLLFLIVSSQKLFALWSMRSHLFPRPVVIRDFSVLSHKEHTHLQNLSHSNCSSSDVRSAAHIVRIEKQLKKKSILLLAKFMYLSKMYFDVIWTWRHANANHPMNYRPWHQVANQARGMLRKRATHTRTDNDRRSSRSYLSRQGPCKFSYPR